MLQLIDLWLLERIYAQGTTGGTTGSSGISGNSFLDFFKFQGANNKDTDATGIFNNLLGRIMFWVLAAIAVIAFIYLIINGVKYITAGGDAAKATEARNGILNAVIGVVIVLVAFIILRFAAGLGANVGSGI